MKVPSIILKNLKIILRSPSTIIILILGPMILMFLIGLAYNNGGSLTSTKVGIFGTGYENFETSQVEFVVYNFDQIQQNNLACQQDLKKGLIELCIFVQTQEKNGQLQSAQLIYIKDNTRGRINDILINMFERILKEKTEKISTNTVSEILTQVDSTLEFVNDSRKLIGDVDEGLNQFQYEINKNDKEITQTISTLKTLVPELIKSTDRLETDLNTLDELSSSDLSSTLNSVEKARKEIDNALDDLDNLNNAVDDIDGIVPNDIFTSINNMESSLQYSSNVLNGVEFTLEQIDNSLNNINTFQTIQSVQNLHENLVDLEPTINDLDINYIFLKDALDKAQTQTSEVKNEIDNRFDYFNALNQEDSSKIVKPISTKTLHLFKEFSRIHELAPSIIIVIILFIGLLLSNVIVSLEVNSKAYFRNLISPVSQKNFIIALFFTSLIIILFQLFFFYIILQFVFGIPSFYMTLTDGSLVILFWKMILITLHLLLVIILLGMLLSLSFNSIQISILVTTFIMLLLFLLSDIILPLELMPQFFYTLISYSPIVIAENMFRTLLFFPNVYTMSISSFLPFYIYAVVLIGFLIIATNKRKNTVL